MEHISEATPALAPGMPLGGGLYAGSIRIDGQLYALVVAPKAEGEHPDTNWIGKTQRIEGAHSYCDGLTNTNAMAEAGSALARWARELRIGGHDDWYLPSQDELEICYRHLKPTTDENWCYARSGINLSATDPTRPYTRLHPARTTVEAFQEGGPEAFDDAWYWSSTLHESNEASAWCQDFYDGGQDYYRHDDELRARAVRRLPL